MTHAMNTAPRWWFRSQHSGRLTFLSWVICVFAISVLVSLSFSVLWRIQASEQARLVRASEYADWVYSPLPRTLKAPGLMSRDSFINVRKELINRVKYGDKGTPPKSRKVLVNAEDVKKPAADFRKGSMLGNPQIQIYPDIVTYSKSQKGGKQKQPGKLSHSEEEIFSNFADFITTTVTPRKQGPDDHMERTLTAALGFADPAKKTDSFVVPWIYVASIQGAIAVYPGTVVIAQDSWEITSRPWYMAAFGGRAQFFSKGPLDDDLLTVTYLDVLGQSPLLVRTYMYKFTPLVKEGEESEEFVIAVDLHRRSERAAGAGPLSDVPPIDYQKIMLAAVSPQNFGRLQYSVFSACLVLILALGWASSTKSTNVVFRQAEARYGDVTLGDVMHVRSQHLQSDSVTIFATIGKMLGLDVRRKREGTLHHRVERQQIGIDAKAETTRAVRGVELWEVQKNATTVWHLLWLQFESSSALAVGRIRLTYTSEILPAVEWLDTNFAAFSEAEVIRMRDRLPRILQQNATSGVLEIPDEPTPIAHLLEPPEIPDWVRAVADTDELGAPRQCRAYVSLSSERITEIYARADVQAVMTGGYFERILEHGYTDFLCKGRTIERLVSFPNKDADLALTEGARNTLKDLLERYASAGKARTLKRVDVEVGNEGTLLRPVYDFAILNDRTVLVAHFISLKTDIDTASGKPTSSTLTVDGYLSWRPSDVEFYRRLFRRLADLSTPLKPAVTQAGKPLATFPSDNGDAATGTHAAAGGQVA